MRLLVVRHAVAVSHTEFAAAGEDDDLRPLTRDGARRMRAAARGLVRLVGDVDVLASSPLVRARETAAILRREYRVDDVEETDSLRPGARFPAFVRWLRTHRGAGVVAVVGHEPHLGALASWLLAGEASSFIVLKKSGACLLDFDAAPGPAKARLTFAVPSGVLRALR